MHAAVPPTRLHVLCHQAAQRPQPGARHPHLPPLHRQHLARPVRMLGQQQQQQRVQQSQERHRDDQVGHQDVQRCQH